MDTTQQRRKSAACLRPVHAVTCTVGVLAMLALTSGCNDGGIGGGAVTPPRVTIKVDAAAFADGAVAETAADDNFVPAGYGTFSGRVVLQGSAPSFPPPVTADGIKPDQAAVCVIGNIPNDRFVVGPNNGVANVFIYLAKRPPGAKMPEMPPAEIVFDQKFCTFEPHALVLLTGQDMRVLNNDAAPHNVNIGAVRNSLPNSTVAPNEREGIVVQYARPEKVPARVRCDIHAWMEAWQLPLDHPYGVVTGPDGSFEIPNLPAGNHEFIVWHEKAGEITGALAVTIEPDQTVTKEIPFDASTLSEFRGDKPRSVVLATFP